MLILDNNFHLYGSSIVIQATCINKLMRATRKYNIKKQETVINLIGEVSQPPNKSNNFVCFASCIGIRWEGEATIRLLTKIYFYVIWNPPLFMFLISNKRTYRVKKHKQASNKHSLVSSYLVKICTCALLPVLFYHLVIFSTSKPYG